MTILATSFTIVVQSIKNNKKNKEGKKRIIRKTEKTGEKETLPVTKDVSFALKPYRIFSIRVVLNTTLIP